MKTILKSLAIIALLGGVALSNPALADKGKGHGNKDKVHHEQQHAPDYRGHDDGHDAQKVYYSFWNDDRDIIKTYLRDRHCPPGLAKKHNGCRPPGHAKVYQPGFVLGPDIHWSPLPHDLLALLHPAPRGYQYVEVDKNVYLIGEASKKIIDAVTLLSALD
jgi:hypothetical protein